MGTPNAANTIIISHIFIAPVDKLWKAWTDEDSLKNWWGPFDFYPTIAKVNLNSGKKTFINLSSKKHPEQGITYSTWEYKNIVYRNRLEFLYNLTDEQGNPLDPRKYKLPENFPQNHLQQVDFKALESSKTKVTITKKDWPIGKEQEKVRTWIEESFIKLDDFLKSEKE